MHKTSVISSDSTHTLIQEENLKSPSDRELHKSTSLSQMRLGVEDFVAALKGFIPVSLRGLQLHKSGLIDFSGVGGLETVKKSLKETLLWPSKVCLLLLANLDSNWYPCESSTVDAEYSNWCLFIISR